MTEREQRGRPKSRGIAGRPAYSIPKPGESIIPKGGKMDASAFFAAEDEVRLRRYGYDYRGKVTQASVDGGREVKGYDPSPSRSTGITEDNERQFLIEDDELPSAVIEVMDRSSQDELL